MRLQAVGQLFWAAVPGLGRYGKDEKRKLERKFVQKPA